MSKKPAKKIAKRGAKAAARPRTRTTIRKTAAAKKAAPKPTAPVLRTGPSNVTWNFKLIAHDTLAGFGGMGEGMAMQVAKDGRRILWLAHESAPKNFTAVDVSDPRKPNTALMTGFAQQMTDDEIKVAAKYFSSIPASPWIKVVESDTVPKTKPVGGIFLPLTGEDAGMEPIGARIIRRYFHLPDISPDAPKLPPAPQPAPRPPA